MGKSRIYLRLFFPFLLLFVSSSCLFVSVRARRVNTLNDRTLINSPTKAHLKDGSMVVFADGFEVTGDVITGDGIWYDLTRELSEPRRTVPRDSVVFLEYYKEELQIGPLLGSLCAPLLFYGAIQNEDIHKAFFGSCPTIYSFQGEQYSLEAECFSYSVSTALETDDLDRIDHADVTEGRLVLNVRNEALETHYINQMKVLIVSHSEGYEAFPANRQFLEPKDKIVLFGRESKILEARSKSGRDVTALLSTRDKHWYRSDSSIVHDLSRRATRDWVELVTEVPRDARTMIVALRFRNTLFHTVQFYDIVLKEQGAEAVDWIGEEMCSLVYLARLQRWYKRYFGLHVELQDGRKFREKAFIHDTGPIAWHDVGLELEVPRGETARIRFSFLPDNIMLDWIGISFDSPPEVAVREVECNEVLGVNRKRDDLSHSLVSEKDDRYLVTYPAESYLLQFEVDDEPEDIEQTYFLSSCGFYVEWVRQDWLDSSGSSKLSREFQLNEAAVTRAARRWIAKKADFENQFFDSKISVGGCSQ